MRPPGWSSAKPPTPTALSAAATPEALLDNPDYQPRNYEDDCKYFGFNPDPDQPRFSTNKPSFFLQSWQITSTRQVLRILENPKVKKCLLADATGLVKIITICAVCTSEAQDAYRLIGTDRAAAKEIKNPTSDFQVYIYHGDERKSRSRTHKKIAEKLTRCHPVTSSEEKNSRVVVITTLVTLRNRHGPSALKLSGLLRRASLKNKQRIAWQSMIRNESLTWQVSSSMSSSTKPYTEKCGHNGPYFGDLA
ncbi:hypothetical protein BPAE_0115g00120 [Botrytis paeoniae]|uniref:Uncharacterized protein n=1 Tax=Botrytis paeoniae TaxID=278948 RepID=A0A4Z1FN44_9HELO|nr:hypothetical protein BPAE_0115g00120 [Botrytis paeoniae]